MSRSWFAVLVAGGLYLVAGRALDGVTGLVRTVVTNPPNRHVVDTRRVETIDLDGIDPAAGGAAGVTAIWRGVWEVPADGLYDLALASDGRSSWVIDGSLANEAASFDAVKRTVWLPAGFHPIEISHQAHASASRLIVSAASTGEPLEPLASAALKPRLPRNPRLRAVARALHQALGWVAVLAALWAIRSSMPALSDRARHWLAVLTNARANGNAFQRWRAWGGRAIAWTALACVLAHGALLRIDAITGRFGTVTSPSWLAVLQTRSFASPEAIRPRSIAWYPEPMFPHRDGTMTQYRSDPYTYLQAGRNMSSFYDAHFREPVFPFATKVFLRVLGGQDVAVSFASAFFSVLAIWFTYLLGASIWSRPIGLLAALGLSLDYDVISLASSGWRDDAYMAVVTLCAYSMLRWWQMEQKGARIYRLGRVQLDRGYVLAAIVGVASGFAVLTRIMAVSFLVAGAAWLLIVRRTAWRRQLIATGLAVVTAMVVAAPYFINCWRVYGDPLYTFNVHGEIYAGAERQAGWKGSTASYVRQKFERRPIEMLDTVVQGLTTYPFGNKWHGLDRWVPGLGRWASIAAIAGLAVLAASARGRLLLIVMVASLVPFSFTWTVDPDFRFTEHVYPILLIAAAVALGAGVRAVRAVLVPGYRLMEDARPRTAWLEWASVVAIALAALWFVGYVSPSLVFAEALRVRDDASVIAGTRDSASFRSGWSNLMRGGNVSMRVATDEAALSIRLPDEGDYPATLRMDPFPRPLRDAPGRLPFVEVVLNGAPVASIPLQWSPDRVGAYDIVLPRAAVRRGVNRLVLRVKRPDASGAAPIRPGLTAGDAVGLWYLRVRPPAEVPNAGASP